MKSQDEIKDDLTKAQIANLAYLEQITSQSPFFVAGVNLVQCCNYDAIQMLNHSWLADYLKDELDA